ncbi:serine protease [Exiguobacterium sp. MH3]|uniref:S1 family peptidase n=1 Tax=Exiguobacterium sp. MH3 TaxID=1399115 RepID=UPI0003C403BF|nr:serine protease [Exiguobacterium sp. MH3]AHA31539.1 hypothetical protein U719_14440 [Exiguobacterium sp. MH3]
MKKWIGVSSLLLLLFFFYTADSVSAASFVVSPEKMTLVTGQTKTIQVKTKGISKPSYSWKTSDRNVVTVSKGKVKAIGAGKAMITVYEQKTKRKQIVAVTVNWKKLDAQAAFKSVNPSVAYIEMINRNGDVTSLGSGFVTKQGEVVTNHHVVSGTDNERARIHFPNGMIYEAKYIKAVDEQLDLAILDVPQMVNIASLRTAKAGSTGSVIYALGSPKGISNTITQGILSNRRVYDGGLPYIQFSATVNPGNSGGPLIDQYGRVIGIVSWKRSDAENMNYAIPYEQLDTVLRKRQTISDIQQQLVEIPVVQGEGELGEQELNDTFDQADIIPYAQGSISGTTFDEEDVDIFRFHTNRNMKLVLLGEYGSQLAPYFKIGLYDVEGEPIQYSEQFDLEGNLIQGLVVNLVPGDYFIAVFPIEGLSATDYQETPYDLLYEFTTGESLISSNQFDKSQQLYRVFSDIRKKSVD